MLTSHRRPLSCEAAWPQDWTQNVDVISHRGYWKTPDEKNGELSFERSFGAAFGTETDLRDRNGTLVISHDPATGEAISAERMLEIHQAHDPKLTLALNIKADGLQGMLGSVLHRFEPADYFVFDMSIPDTLQWMKHGVPFFTRQSEVEPSPALYAQAAGVWLDGFDSEWWDIDVIRRHVDAGKRVCIVSPDLHKRDHRPEWDRLASNDFIQESRQVILCTDFPEEARKLFK